MGVVTSHENFGAKIDLSTYRIPDPSYRPAELSRSRAAGTGAAESRQRHRDQQGATGANRTAGDGGGLQTDACAARFQPTDAVHSADRAKVSGHHSARIFLAVSVSRD